MTNREADVLSAAWQYVQAQQATVQRVLAHPTCHTGEDIACASCADVLTSEARHLGDLLVAVQRLRP